MIECIHSRLNVSFYALVDDLDCKRNEKLKWRIESEISKEDKILTKNLVL